MTKLCEGCNRKPVVPPKRKCVNCLDTSSYRVTTLKSSKARPRTLSLGKANKPRTKRAKRQGTMGNSPILRQQTYRRFV